MFTKPLTRRTIATHDFSKDMSAINRLLIAASISPRFCLGLLHDPGQAVRAGFGGEQFQISESTLNLMSSIHVSSLPEFVQQLDQYMSHKLLAADVAQNNL
jgi:hypothetical protein